MKEHLKDVAPNLKRSYAEGCPFPSDTIVDTNVHLQRFSVQVTLLLIVLAIALAVVSISTVIISLKPDTTLTFGITEDRRIVELEPVEQAYSPDQVNGFAADSVESVLNISFTDYGDHFEAISKKFTSSGFDSFQNALIDNGWMDKIKDDGMTMWVEVRQAPKLTAAGLVSGTYTYELVFAIDLYMGGGKQMFKPTRLEVELRIERSVDTLDGLKIDRIYLKEPTR